MLIPLAVLDSTFGCPAILFVTEPVGDLEVTPPAERLPSTEPKLKMNILTAEIVSFSRESPPMEIQEAFANGFKSDGMIWTQRYQWRMRAQRITAIPKKNQCIQST